MIDVEANTTKTPAEAAATPEPKMPLTVSCTASCVGLLCNLQGKLSSDSSKVANIRSVWLWFSGHCFKWCLPPPQPQHAHGRTGDVRYAADGRAGVAVAAGTCRKRDVTYPKFTASRRCHLIVCGIETCGRWGDEAIALLCGLAQAKAREAPPYLRGASAGAYTSRWAWPSQPNGRSRRACSSCPWVGSTWCWRTRATTRAHRPVVYLWEGGCTWDTGKKEMSRCFDSSAFRDCIVRIVVAQVSTVPYICTQNIRTCLTFGCPCSLVKKNHLVFFIETTLQSWVAWGSSWGGRTGTMSVHEGQPSKFPTWKALPLGHKESQGAGAGQCQSGRTIEVVQRKSNWGNLAIPISNHSKRNFAW